MDSPEIMISFAAVMLVIALLAVAVDWFGKPLRHRKFRPKIYRFPDERQPRRSQVRQTEWSDTAFVLPIVDEPAADMLVRYPDPRALADLAGPRALGPYHPAQPGGGAPDAVAADHDDADAAVPGAAAPGESAASLRTDDNIGYVDTGPPTTQVPVGVAFDPGGDSLLHLVTLEDTHGPEAAGLLDPVDPAGGRSDDTDAAHDIDGIAGVDQRGQTPAGVDRDRARGWKPGDYVFNLTQSGAEPAPDTIRSRYWKNVANTRGTAMFGRGNTDRMAAGKPPERRNPRTGKVEVMRLPQVDHAASGGETPVPEWPSAGLDPFAPPTAE